VRHGAANDRQARLKAYSQVRQWLALDPAIDRGLRAVLQKRLEELGVNPMEDSVFRQADIARRQYAALLRYAEDPEGLAARLERDREAELTAYHHGVGTRFGFRMANLATLGAFTHHEQSCETLEMQLAQERRVARQLEFLERVAQSGSQAEVVWNMEEVRRALDQIGSSRIPARSALLVQKILNETSDEETRALCQKALMSLDAGGAQ
jgi:ketosteroid isomerase-like protein